MKFKLLLIVFLTISSVTFSQSKSSLWNATTKKSDMVALDSRMQLPEKNLFKLNLLHAFSTSVGKTLWII